MRNPHVLAIPFPAQGHVIPLMELSLWLTKRGIRITFVNTKENHIRVKSSWELKGDNSDLIHLVALPDGSESLEDMPGKLEVLIDEINESEEDKIFCVLADQGVGWALEIASRKGIQRAAFCPAAAVNVVVGSSIPKLIEDGIIDEHGTLKKRQMIKLSPTMPEMSTAELVWVCFKNIDSQRGVFDLVMTSNKARKLSTWNICNSVYNLETSAFSTAPDVLPIGPLLASNRKGQTVGSLWPEDSTCLEWLDHQPPRSVIFISFGSISVCEPTQFQELLIGLELTARPFLLVVREGFAGTKQAIGCEVGKLGKLVTWAPQQQVLGHPSTACFLSHCGWNSTMEAVSNGIPLLCWPHFGDQFFNRTYICDVWRVGLRLDKEERNGLVTREDIRNRVEELLGDEEIKGRALELKEVVMASVMEGGGSYSNLMRFVNWIRGLETDHRDT